jgi:general stress protein 26
MEHAMTDIDSKAEERLWKTLEDTRVGMLGISGGPSKHMQPMTGFRDGEEKSVWFFTRRDTDLARDVAAGHEAMFCLISKDRELYACLGGQLSPDHDQAKIDKHWNPMVAAWYPEGKDDPALTLLRLDVADAQIWLSEKGPIRLAYEVAKANLTKTTPDAGDQVHLRFQ